MREKILAALANAGHGLTPRELNLSNLDLPMSVEDWELLKRMEQERLLILHRSSSASDRGAITLVCLRPENY